MHSALTRLQNVFGFFTTVAFFVGALTALSVFLSPGSPSAEVRVSNVQVYVWLLSLIIFEGVVGGIYGEKETGRKRGESS